MKIAVAADKAGFDLKETIKTYLTNKGYEVLDQKILLIRQSQLLMPFWMVQHNAGSCLTNTALVQQWQATRFMAW